MHSVFNFCFLALIGLLISASSLAHDQAAPKASHELKLSRPTASPTLEGTVVNKAINLKEDSPFLPVGAATGAVQTKRGQVFTRDTSNPKLGEAWRDPSGKIWGDIVKDDKGKVRAMNHDDAKKYCESMGASLPSRDDFIRLREYMGAKPGTRDGNSSEGYSAQVLPNLTYEEGGRTYGHWFWSTWVHPGLPQIAYHFDGRKGVIGPTPATAPIPVRCVG